MATTFETSKEFALAKDHSDPLKTYANEFYSGENKNIYLDGNSLGRLPWGTKRMMDDVITKQWGGQLIESWNKHWYLKPGQLGNKIAPIIGASSGEVVVCDNTSTNLYKLAHAALGYNKGKTRIVSDIFNFPTDLYILQGLIKQFGNVHQMVLANSDNDISIDLDDLKGKIDRNTALVVLSLVAFKSSFLYPAELITEWAHKNDALVLWDLSHAAGAIPIHLNTSNADLAVGCTYKYLNGGPGSPAFLYVRKDLQEKMSPPIQGWFGDNQPFEFELDYRPASGIRKFLTGTPPILSLMAIENGIELFARAGIENIYAKSKLQSGYFIFLVDSMLNAFGFLLGSPPDPKNRGSHVSLRHPEAFRVCKALIAPKNGKVKITPDFREPNNLRFGFTPLYTSFTDIWTTVQRLKEIMETSEYRDFSTTRSAVT